MKSVELPEGIILEINGARVRLTSDLKKGCPQCGIAECNFDCDGSQVAYSNAKDSVEQAELNEEHLHRMMWNSAVDGVESMIVACAGAGIDVEDARFHEAVQSALDKISNEFGE